VLYYPQAEHRAERLLSKMGEALMKNLESGDAKADVRKNQKAIADFMQEFKAKMSAMLQLV
jgi:hypothetical protein